MTKKILHYRFLAYDTFFSIFWFEDDNFKPQSYSAFTKKGSYSKNHEFNVLQWIFIEQSGIKSLKYEIWKALIYTSYVEATVNLNIEAALAIRGSHVSTNYRKYQTAGPEPAKTWNFVNQDVFKSSWYSFRKWMYCI